MTVEPHLWESSPYRRIGPRDGISRTRFPKASARNRCMSSCDPPPFCHPPAYVSFGTYRMESPRSVLCARRSESAPIWLSGPFEVLAHTRDAHGYAWGKLVRWRDIEDACTNGQCR